jgi:hypothetical protein
VVNKWSQQMSQTGLIVVSWLGLVVSCQTHPHMLSVHHETSPQQLVSLQGPCVCRDEAPLQLPIHTPVFSQRTVQNGQRYNEQSFLPASAL